MKNFGKAAFSKRVQAQAACFVKISLPLFQGGVGGGYHHHKLKNF